jgi:hypothetical protein
MGRREWRTGDLMRPISGWESGVGLWSSAYIVTDNASCIVGACKLGMLVCVKDIDWPEPDWPEPGSMTMALVLDTSTGRYGWCDVRDLKRVK